MSKESKTARSSAVKNAPKEKVVLTSEKAIQEIRNLRAGKLAVLNVEYIDLLLADYDRALDQLRSANSDNGDLTGDLQLERQQHVDTKAELTAVLDKREELSPELFTLGILVRKVAPNNIIEGEPIAESAIRVIELLKEQDDINAVSTRDLMTTVKRLEGQLATFGVVVNPNPDIPTFQS